MQVFLSYLTLVRNPPLSLFLRANQKRNIIESPYFLNKDTFRWTTILKYEMRNGVIVLEKRGVDPSMWKCMWNVHFLLWSYIVCVSFRQFEHLRTINAVMFVINSPEPNLNTHLKHFQMGTDTKFNYLNIFVIFNLILNLELYD